MSRGHTGGSVGVEQIDTDWFTAFGPA